MVVYDSANGGGSYSDPNAWNPVAPAGGPTKTDTSIITPGNPIDIDSVSETGVISIDDGAILTGKTGSAMKRYGPINISRQGRFNVEPGFEIISLGANGMFLFDNTGAETYDEDYGVRMVGSADNPIILSGSLGSNYLFNGVAPGPGATLSYIQMEHVRFELSAWSGMIDHIFSPDGRVKAVIKDLIFDCINPDSDGFVFNGGSTDCQLYVEWDNWSLEVGDAYCIGMLTDGKFKLDGTIDDVEIINNSPNKATVSLQADAEENSLVVTNPRFINRGTGVCVNVNGGLGPSALNIGEKYNHCKFFNAFYQTAGATKWRTESVAQTKNGNWLDYGSNLKPSEIVMGGAVGEWTFKLIKKFDPTFKSESNNPIADVSVTATSGKNDPATGQPYDQAEGSSGSDGKMSEDMYLITAYGDRSGLTAYSDSSNPAKIAITQEGSDQYRQGLSGSWTLLSAPISSPMEENYTGDIYLQKSPPSTGNTSFIQPILVVEGKGNDTISRLMDWDSRKALKSNVRYPVDARKTVAKVVKSEETLDFYVVLENDNHNYSNIFHYKAVETKRSSIWRMAYEFDGIAAPMPYFANTAALGRTVVKISITAPDTFIQGEIASVAIIAQSWGESNLSHSDTVLCIAVSPVVEYSDVEKAAEFLITAQDLNPSFAKYSDEAVCQKFIDDRTGMVILDVLDRMNGIQINDYAKIKSYITQRVLWDEVNRINEMVEDGGGYFEPVLRIIDAEATRIWNMLTYGR